MYLQRNIQTSRNQRRFTPNLSHPYLSICPLVSVPESIIDIVSTEDDDNMRECYPCHGKEDGDNSQGVAKVPFGSAVPADEDASGHYYYCERTANPDRG